MRLVYRLFALRAQDGDAEKLARCAPDYLAPWMFFSRNQDKWDPEFGISDSRPPLLALAASFGLSADKANACINDTSQDARINAVAQEAQSRYHVHGTPTFVIDGVVQPSGYQPVDENSAAHWTPNSPKSAERRQRAAQAPFNPAASSALSASSLITINFMTNWGLWL